jgi:hypothetical protein
VEPGDGVVVVDGEAFTVHVRVDGTHDFRWSSGPNAGYGFSSGYPAGFAPTGETIERDIRTFLAMIDPRSGYIAE